MNTQDNPKPSFYDLLLQATLQKTESEPQIQKSTTTQKSFWYVLGLGIGFLFYCFIINLGYNVIATKFKIPILNFVECIEIAAAIIALRRFILKK